MGGERAGPVNTDALSGNRRSFVFGLKCEESNMPQVLGVLAPLKSIIDRKISDGSDALSKSSALDDDEVRRGKVFMVGSSPRSYGYYEAHACAIAALSRTMKPYNIFSDDRAARRLPVSHIATFCVYLLPPGRGVGWRGFSLQVRVSSRGTDGACRSLLDEAEAFGRKP